MNYVTNQTMEWKPGTSALDWVLRRWRATSEVVDLTADTILEHFLMRYGVLVEAQQELETLRSELNSAKSHLTAIAESALLGLGAKPEDIKHQRNLEE